MNDVDLNLIIQNLDDSIQTNLENIALKKEIEQLKEQIKILQSKNISLIRENNTLKENLSLANIEISNLKQEIKHENEKRKLIEIQNSDQQKSKQKKSTNPYITENSPQGTNLNQAKEKEEYRETEITESDIEMLFSASFDSSDSDDEKKGKTAKRSKSKEFPSFLKPITQVHDLVKQIHETNIDDMQQLAQTILIESHSTITSMKKHLSIVVNSILVWLHDFGEKDVDTERFVAFLSNLILLIAPDSWENITKQYKDNERVRTLLDLHKVEIYDKHALDVEEEEDYFDLSNL